MTPRLCLAGLCLALLASGCGGSDSFPPPASGRDNLGVPCGGTLDDVYKTPESLEPFTDGQRGAVVGCAFDKTISLGGLTNAIEENGYQGKAPESGVTVYRVAYRTTRVAGQRGPSEGISSALVFLPEKVKDPRVLVVTGHGTVGFSDKCTPSLENQLETGGDTHTLNLALAGFGWTTIAPDYAGFFYDGTPQGWSLAEDEAHSILDATRAMSRIMQDPETDAPVDLKVVLVGHSQGGHAVLAAQALAKKYGLSGEIVGVAGFAPLWIPPRTWGAALSPLAGLTTEKDPDLLSIDLLYFYGHGELYDGPGGGVAMIQPEKQADVKRLLTQYCSDEVAAQMTSLGADPSEYFEQKFLDDVSNCAVFATHAACSTGAAKTWNQRFKADRPKIDADGAPIVIWHGKEDPLIPPDRAKCGFDRIKADLEGAPKSMFTVCGDKDGTHGSVVERDIEWVNRWILARTSGADEPEACPGEDALAPKSGTLTCATPPPNDAD